MTVELQMIKNIITVVGDVLGILCFLRRHQLRPLDNIIGVDKILRTPDI